MLAAQNGPYGYRHRADQRRGERQQAHPRQVLPALIVAAQNGYLEIVKCLISAGANINCYINNYRTPLTLAAQNGHAEIVAILIAAGADVD